MLLRAANAVFFFFLVSFGATGYASPDYLQWGNLKNGGIKSVSTTHNSSRNIAQSLTDKNLGGKYKKLYLVADIQTKITSSNSWAGLWIRLENKNGETIGLENMENRPIKGTSTVWKKYSTSIYVPNEATSVIYGVLLSGNGEVNVKNGMLTFK